MTEQESFIKKLSALLEEKDITQRELAEKIDVTEVTISRYLSGERTPRMEIVSKIANYFNVTIDYLLGKVDKNISTLGDTDFRIGLSRAEEGSLSEEEKQQIRDFAKYVISKRNEGN